MTEVLKCFWPAVSFPRVYALSRLSQPAGENSRFVERVSFLRLKSTHMSSEIARSDSDEFMNSLLCGASLWGSPPTSAPPNLGLRWQNLKLPKQESNVILLPHLVSQACVALSKRENVQHPNHPRLKKIYTFATQICRYNSASAMRATVTRGQLASGTLEMEGNPLSE